MSSWSASWVASSLQEQPRGRGGSKMWQIWNKSITLPIFDLQTCNAPQKIGIGLSNISVFFFFSCPICNIFLPFCCMLFCLVCDRNQVLVSRTKNQGPISLSLFELNFFFPKQKLFFLKCFKTLPYVIPLLGGGIHICLFNLEIEHRSSMII